MISGPGGDGTSEGRAVSGGDGESGHRAAPGAAMAAAQWDERYAGSELIWGAGANRWVAQYTDSLAPGRAVDLACGEGRNAVYLAERGWQVVGVDFSAAAIDKARRLERSRAEAGALQPPIRWVCADVTSYQPEPVDLALVVYLHLPAPARRAVLTATVAALAPGGTVLVIGHSTRNIAEGTGGPQDPGLLYTVADIVTDLAGIAPELVVDTASEPLRDVSGAPRPAIDTVVRAHRP
jgi:SAM-dependent methyltransferase